MPKTDTDGTRPERSGTFMGKRRTVQPCPDCDSLLSQPERKFLAVLIRKKGYRTCLMGPGKYQKS